TVFWVWTSKAANEWCAVARLDAAATSTTAINIMAAHRDVIRMPMLMWLILFRRVSRERQIDSGLARRIDGVPVVFLADVFGDRPVAITPRHTGVDVRA